GPRKVDAFVGDERGAERRAEFPVLEASRVPAFWPRILYRWSPSQNRRQRPGWSPEEGVGEHTLLRSPVGETCRDQTARSAGHVIGAATAKSKMDSRLRGNDEMV